MFTRRCSAAAMAVALTIAAGAITTSTDAGAALPANPTPRCASVSVCIAVGDASILEGTGGSRTVTFPLTLNRPASATVTAQYAIAGITATGGASAASGVDVKDKGGALTTVKFTPGTSGFTTVSKNIVITVYGDTNTESNETFAITLKNVSGAVLQRSRGIGTIIDDDSTAGLTLGVGDAAAQEGDTGTGRKVAVPIMFSAAPGSAASVAYTVTPGLASNPADFTGKLSGTLSFTATTASKKLMFTVVSDTGVELDESFTVAITPITVPVGTTVVRSTGTGTLIDDDPVAATAAVPSSMAVLGDSISRGFDTCPPIIGECLTASWGTGTAIDSHYRRILAVNPAMAGNGFNDAVSGATISNLPGQAATAVGQNVGYVLILMGANDACKSNEASMTSTATFQTHVTNALTTISNGLPSARIAVVSIPDIHRLWEVGSTSAAARNAWSTFGICQSMLANPLSTAQTDIDRRARVRQRVVDYNTILANTCAATANCVFDGNVVFNYSFILSDLSPIDYFHPSLDGEALLAQGSYAAGYNW